jgi:hypothetical protein
LDGQSTLSTAPDPALVLEGLDAEISRLVEEQRAPGWTNWAVLAGVGTLLWAIAGLEHVRYTRSLLLLVVAMSLTVDLLLHLRNWLSPSEQGPARFVSTKSVAPQRLFFVTYMLRSAALVWAVLWISDDWYDVAVVAVIWAYGWNGLVLGLFPLISSWIDNPLPVGSIDTSKMASPTVAVGATLHKWSVDLALIVGTLAFGSAALSAWRAGAYAVDDLRFAGAIVAIVFLAGKIVSDVPNATVNALIAIRRDLAFNFIDASTAINQADIALWGKRFSDVVQKEVSAFLRQLKSCRAECHQISRNLASLGEVLPSTGTYSQGHVAVVRSVLDSCQRHVVSLKMNKTTAGMMLNVIKAKARIASAEDKAELVERLSAELNAVSTQFDAVSVSIVETQTRLPGVSGEAVDR